MQAPGVILEHLRYRWCNCDSPFPSAVILVDLYLFHMIAGARTHWTQWQHRQSARASNNDNQLSAQQPPVTQCFGVSYDSITTFKIVLMMWKSLVLATKISWLQELF